MTVPQRLRLLVPALLRHVSMAAAAVVAASLMRGVLLSALGPRIAWVTFYPAVTLAALYGGLVTGMLAALGSCLAVVYAWPLLCAVPFVKDSADWLGLFAFVFNCLLISGVAEASRRARLQAEHARTAAEHANKAKSVFLATMSHELRTPLNAILGFSSLMRDDTTMLGEHREMLSTINRSGEHLLKLIDDVLDMARVESGKVTISHSPFCLTGMLGDLVHLMSVRAEAKGLTLRMQTASDVPEWVSSDEARIRQVLTNLLGNAIRYTDQGGIDLRVRMDAQSGAAPLPMLVIEVADTGPGIAAGDTERVFQAFVQVGTTAGQQGTGLGLAITRQLVNALGGGIELESIVGRGALFRVRLPVAPAEPDVEGVSDSTEGGTLRLAPGTPEVRVLIADDNVDNRLLLKRIVERAGFTAQVAHNGVEAVKLFEAWRPAFIWMDCRMPIMDGLEAARRIRSSAGGDEPKIVALTASVFKEEHQNVLAAGMDDLVRKPAKPEAILACMCRLLGLSYVSVLSATAPRQQPTGPLDAVSLLRLPASVRADLAAALVTLDRQTVAAAVASACVADATLGQILRSYTDRLRYSEVRQALQVAESATEMREH
ncbi:MAG: ATP-binding protein [Armatimonadetes bacterium]|nr:ATP-binding protein [Armatimonadota bacterium]